MVASSQPMNKLIGRTHISETSNILLNIFTFGIFYVITKVFLSLRILLKTAPAPLGCADCVILEDQYRNLQLIKVEKIQVKETFGLLRYIKDGFVTVLDTCYGRFIYDCKLDRFVLPNFDFSANIKGFDELYQESIMRSRIEELSENYEIQIIFGKNSLGIHIPTIFEIIIDKIFAPLFIWEMISLAIWISIDYFIYAVVVGAIFIKILISGIIQECKNRSELIKRNKIGYVKILRDGSFKLLPEVEVLPGDLIYLNLTDNFSCDCEILKGDIIVDESFLTGESVPICKGIGSIVYSGTKILKSTLESVSLQNFHNDKLVKVKNLTLKSNHIPIHDFPSESNLIDTSIGLVIKTGKGTKRGQIFKNLAVKRPSLSEFTLQSNRIIYFLILGSIWLLVIFFLYLAYSGLQLSSCFRYSLDLALAFFNPSLYTSLELGSLFARTQLLDKKVITTDITRINTAGEVDLTIFDKTGTLTELGVDIFCFDTLNKSIIEVEDLDYVSRMALSSCHHVLELDSQYSGDMLDMRMFLFSQSKIINKDNKRFIEMEAKNNFKAICKEYANEDDKCTLFFNSENNHSAENESYPEDTLEILKIYEFDLYLKRLSVVLRDYKGQKFLFCKGAPDTVCKFLDDVPKTYMETVKDYGLQGHRVLTVAYRELTEFTHCRTKDECHLKFLGFLVFANKLKDETTGVIQELREANLNPKMCTGDNILTAISVAKECGMIDRHTPVLFPVIEDECKSYYDSEWFCVADEDYIFDKLKVQLYDEVLKMPIDNFVVAIEGKEYEYLKNSNFSKFILEKGVVFARFNPDNKKDLVEEYSKSGFVTLFCGDGANDAGALSSADVGVSLACNEASLAAHFSSSRLSSVSDAIKEGRSALSFSAAQFKYVLYAQVLTGFQMLSLLPQLYFPSDGMSLVSDLISCYALGYALLNFQASNKISKHKIQVSLIYDAKFILYELLSILPILLFNSFVIKPEINSADIVTPPINPVIIKNSKNSGSIFIIVLFLVVYRSFKFADFGLHRQSRFSNYRFLSIFGCCLLISCVLISLIIMKNSLILQFFQIEPLQGPDLLRTFISFCFVLLATVIYDFYFTSVKSQSKDILEDVPTQVL